DQAMIDKFADATGDHQWIHVDVERARREMPGGKTIAHGYLTLSLVPRLAATLVKVDQVKRGVNYGSNRVRFTAPVPAGARVRLRLKIGKVEPVEGNGVRVTNEVTMEIGARSGRRSWPRSSVFVTRDQAGTDALATRGTRSSPSPAPGSPRRGGENELRTV